MYKYQCNLRIIAVQTTTGPYVIIVDGVRRQADVLDVPAQLRQHLHGKNLLHKCLQVVTHQCEILIYSKKKTLHNK